MKKQLALSTIVLFLSAPSLADTKCKMTSSGNRVCGSQEKISTAKPSDSSFFSFWNNDKDEEANTTPKTSIKKNEAKDVDEQPNNNSTNVVENEDVKKQNNPANSKKILVEESQKIQKEINNSYLSVTTEGSSKGVVLSCGKSSLLFPRQTLSTDTESLDVLADRSEISKKDNYLLTGNVSLNSSQYYLAADTINIQKSSKTSMASGNVKFQDDELMFIGNKAVIKKQDDITYTTLEQVNFHYPESKINGQAQKVTNDGNEQVFNSATYSLCPLGKSDWKIRAQQITLNSDENKGFAKNATLEFFDIPIAYVPYHEWVLKGRGSGFLAPGISLYDESSTKEKYNYGIRIPYYFNIALDRDFLLTLSHLSSRGSIIEGKYRQLLATSDYWNNGRLEIESHYLNKDDITNKKRWLLNSKLDLSLNPETNLNIVTNRVSDENYFKEILHGNTSISALNSYLNLSYRPSGHKLRADDEYVSGSDLTSSLFYESEQLVNSGTASYTREPEITINKNIGLLDDRNIKLSLISTKFAHKDSSNTTGIRTHAEVNFSRPIKTNAYLLEPKLNLTSTYYSLDKTTNKSRSIAGFGLNSSLFLERELSLFNTNLIQTLVPKLSYKFTPKKNQGNLPIFDSADKEDFYKNLFSDNKYTGFDRISNANDITFGIESDFIDELTGDTYLELRAGQTFYGDDQVVSSTNGVNFDSRREYSNISAIVNLFLDKFEFENSLEFNPQNNKIAKHDSRATYKLNSRKFLTLVHDDDGYDETIELYGVYPINQKIHVFAGLNRSITDKITNRETTGFAYESCCWAFRVAHFKSHINESHYDYSTSFELIFKGLASTSPSLYERLEENIPNYLANLDFDD